jgi:tight adherence protein C
MALLLTLGLVLFAASAGLLVRGIAMSRVRISAQLRQIEAYGFHSDGGTGEVGGRQSLLVRLEPLAERVGRRVSGSGVLAPLDGLVLRSAGMYHISPAAFHGYRVIAALGFPVLLLLLSAAGGSVSGQIVLVSVLGGLICWTLLPVIVKRRAQQRMDQLDRALPELIDLLIATVEAGLGFAGSLRMVASRFDGPLGQELRLMLREQSLGLSTEESLTNLLERCETASLRAFVRAVTQGESLGVSIGAMLRNLASETRARRRQVAREKIMKVPVKMLFPLVFFIFPSMLIVLLYPAVVSTIHALSNS